MVTAYGSNTMLHVFTTLNRLLIDLSALETYRWKMHMNVANIIGSQQTDSVGVHTDKCACDGTLPVCRKRLPTLQRQGGQRLPHYREWA